MPSPGRSSSSTRSLRAADFALPAGEATLERWNVAGGERSLEISIKVKGRDAREAENALEARVTSLGLHASSAQKSKTKAAPTALTR